MRPGSRTSNTGSPTSDTGSQTSDTGSPTSVTGAGTEVFRLTPPLVFWWVWLAFVLANVIDFAVQGAQARFVAVVLAILAAGTGLAYTLALRPRVLAGQAGVTVLNPFRTHHLPWPAVRSVDVAEWVRVHYAQDKTVHCWALVASARDRRRAGRPAMVPRLRRSAGRGFADAPAASEPAASGVSRLPEEARRLASLSPAQAIATRLDALARQASASADGACGPVDGTAVTSRWSWPAIAAVVIPAVALVIVLAA